MDPFCFLVIPLVLELPPCHPPIVSHPSFPIPCSTTLHSFLCHSMHLSSTSSPPFPQTIPSTLISRNQRQTLPSWVPIVAIAFVIKYILFFTLSYTFLFFSYTPVSVVLVSHNQPHIFFGFLSFPRIHHSLSPPIPPAQLYASLPIFSSLARNCYGYSRVV